MRVSKLLTIASVCLILTASAFNSRADGRGEGGASSGGTGTGRACPLYGDDSQLNSYIATLRLHPYLAKSDLMARCGFGFQQADCILGQFKTVSSDGNADGIRAILRDCDPSGLH
jgi:hypothetical protein